MKNKVIWFASPKNKYQVNQRKTSQENLFYETEIEELNFCDHQEDIWCSLNFQWLPILKLRKSLKS